MRRNGGVGRMMTKANKPSHEKEQFRVLGKKESQMKIFGGIGKKGLKLCQKM